MDLASLPVYDEGFQRTYFEGQNHLAKGDLGLAYTSFLACLDMQPEEHALHFDLAKIDLQREQYESAVNHLNPVLEADETTAGPTNTAPKPCWPWAMRRPHSKTWCGWCKRDRETSIGFTIGV